MGVGRKVGHSGVVRIEAEEEEEEDEGDEAAAAMGGDEGGDGDGGDGGGGECDKKSSPTKCWKPVFNTSTMLFWEEYGRSAWSWISAHGFPKNWRLGTLWNRPLHEGLRLRSLREESKSELPTNSD